MKKKIILALTVCLFAAGSIINMHLAQNNHNTDISLADISVIAQANGEGDVGLLCMFVPNQQCVWIFGDGDSWWTEGTFDW